jgi:hypothetical protein
MTGSGPTAGALQVQGALRESLRLLLANYRTLFVLALAPALLEEALLIAVLSPQQLEAQQTVTTGLVLVGIFSNLASHFIVALVTLAAVDCVTARERTLGTYLRIVGSNFVPILVLGAIVSVVAGLAAIFLVIPGLYVYAQFFVWLPCLMFERTGFGALARAQALTRGHRWQIVGALGTLLLVFVGAVIVLSPLWSAVGQSYSGMLSALVSSLFSAVSYAVIGTFGAVVYLRLRLLEDGTTPDRIAAAI